MKLAINILGIAGPNIPVILQVLENDKEGEEGK